MSSAVLSACLLCFSIILTAEHQRVLSIADFDMKLHPSISCRSLVLIQDDDGEDHQADDDDDHSGEDEDGIDSANSNVQYPSPRKSSSPAQHHGGSPHVSRASPDGPRTVSDSDESGSWDSAPTKQLVTPATKTGAAKPTVPSPGALAFPSLCNFLASPGPCLLLHGASSKQDW